MDNCEACSLPDTQYAVQLIGPGELKLNTHKPVPRPKGRQILLRVEAVGLCFSDLKLLKLFSAHPRKSKIISGLPAADLAGLAGYVPGDAPTVPGHEAVCRIAAVGPDVRHYKVGQRCMVQADFRQLATAGANAAFGYNIEGGLQQYALLDERVVVDPATGEQFLMPVSNTLSASAACLVEPWACVENSYASQERRTIKAGGRLLVAAEPGRSIEGLAESFSPKGRPAAVTAACTEQAQLEAIRALGAPLSRCEQLADLADEGFDDIVYFGAKKAALDVLNDKLAAYGIINIVVAGERIGRPVSINVGRVHYGRTRWIGTKSSNAAESYKVITATGEIHPGQAVAVIGAGGPMGQMHVIRDICSGVAGISVVATDLDDVRLAALHAKAGPLAAERNVPFRLVNTRAKPLDETFDYFALMAPVGQLVADAIRHARDGCRISIFAGIPTATKYELDMDTYIERRCFMFGTSGSELSDMRTILAKVESGRLDANCSVDAVSGMAGAADGIAAVENRAVAGKIVVYPSLADVRLVPLKQLAERFPTVAGKLNRGMWCKAAEDELLAVAGKNTP
ncbi:MAG: alcohol dehydrogenase catalytic domain-containing protein [Planctomycetota bacterium]|nr:alcohol dehydrogenase catalytic domain-containing protein [Planctomycetota bacterium]